MPIVVDIDVMLARRKMSVGELADRVGITPANLAVLKNGRAKAVRFATLAALCEVLGCQPGDLLRWEPEEAALLPTSTYSASGGLRQDPGRAAGSSAGPGTGEDWGT
jgi:putative transcriptional regulator